MAYRSLSSLIPDAGDVLSLAVEELAGILLIHLNSYEGVAGNSIYQNGVIGHHNFFGSLTPSSALQKPEYGDKQPEISYAFMEAWAWLQSAGLLVEKAGSPGWFFVSRRGKQIVSREDFGAYLKAQLLPRSQIHALIAAKVYPAFLRGEYDTAIFQAFREIEIAVRNAGSLPQTVIGEKLMRAAFATGSGPLCDKLLPSGEQEAMSHLFTGAFGLYRNSTGHRYVPIQAEEAAEVIMFASQLLRIVDRLAPPTGAKP
jgi:uncharacterized protein (TIGR02391 family)